MLSPNYLHNFLTILATFIVSGWCFSWLMHIIAIIHGFRTLYRKRSPSVESGVLPGVSIIKPLLGVDPNLSKNLESFFLLDYPEFELLFCVKDLFDPAIHCVEELMEKYPNISANLFIGGKAVGVNPKINNMQPGYEAAKHELILISDSGIIMLPDTLTDMVSCMKEDVGLVHQMPFVVDQPEAFPSVLEKVYFGTAHARIYLVADFFGLNCSTGMSALMRKNLLDDVGGIAKFGNYLAEDYFFAKSLISRGWRLKIATQPAWQNSCTADIETFQNRLTRWAKLRIAMVPPIILLEPLSECFLLGAIVSWAISFLFPHYDPFAVYLFHILFWFLFDYTLLKVVQRSKLPFSKIDFVIAWLLRELFAIVLFAKALYEPDIHWRTGTFKLKWGGFAEEAKKELISSNYQMNIVNNNNNHQLQQLVKDIDVNTVAQPEPNKEPKYQIIKIAL